MNDRFADFLFTTGGFRIAQQQPTVYSKNTVYSVELSGMEESA